MLSDAETINRMQSMAGRMNHYIDLPQTVSLINQERSNNKLYVSLPGTEPHRLLRRQDAAQPACFGSERDAGRARSNRSLVTSPESASEQMALPFDYVISGSYSLQDHGEVRKIGRPLINATQTAGSRH